MAGAGEWMNARKWTAILAGLMAVAGLAATAAPSAGLLDYLLPHDPPVQVRVRMDSSGFALRQGFRIRKYCGYDVDLRLIHVHNRMHELDALLTNETLPINVTVDVYQAQDERTARVAQLSGMPTLGGHAPTMTILSVGKVKLDKGDYRIEVSSTGDVPQLAGIEADFVMQMTPKTTCAKKPAT
jgi:hypothetical protein